MGEKQTVTYEDWRSAVAGVHIPKQQLNSLVLNYLITEGYREAAEKFREESGCHSDIDPEEIDHRMRIRKAVMEGEIDEAISAVNEFDAEILDRNPELLFRLRLQKLIEYIKNGAVQEALAFSQDVLAPATISQPKLLKSLEEVMSLLAFENPAQSPVGYLVQNAQLQVIASDLNAALLASSGHTSDAKITVLMKTLNWSQRRLQDCISFPTS